MSFEGLSIPIKAIDEATAVFKKVSDEAQTSLGNVDVATKRVTETQEKASLGMKDTVARARHRKLAGPSWSFLMLTRIFKAATSAG